MIRTVKTAEKAHELGTNHNNSMAHQNGLDEIDLWAMNQGKAQRAKRQITPVKKHIYYV